MPNVAEEYEALLQFLYLAPVGLAQASLSGEVLMLNPKSAQWLMPLSRDGRLDNLFTVLEGVAPQLRSLVAAFEEPSGVVCDSIRIQAAAGAASLAAPQVISVCLLKLEGLRLMAVFSDVTLETQREQIMGLNDAARLDGLTRMPDRAAVREQIQRAMARTPAEAGSGFAVLFMNCDRFTQINDTLGPAAGDEVLGLMADRLRATLRPHDPIGRQGGAGDALAQTAARVGGDEFVVVLDDMRRPDDVHMVAQRLLDVLAKPYGIGARQFHCSVSMGVVLRAQAAGDADAVLQDASIAMVEAKRAGGGCCVVFEPGMRERAARRGSIAADLRVALAEGQLFVVYQPMLALQSAAGAGTPRGVEALVRWRHPVRGVVPPLEFIGVAEACGLIGAVGDFVLATACRQFVQWQQQLGPRAPRMLAVNLSRAQLKQTGWVDTVRHILQDTAMDPQRLQLEVTESLAAQDDSVQARLHELKALRLTLALDDFGTGRSSLSSLHLLPVDTIKIDRTFVSKADTSVHLRVLIEATVRVAGSLGMGTVAEGIETEAQAAVMRQLGCEKGQGYLFSRPLPAGDMAGWLEAAQAPA